MPVKDSVRGRLPGAAVVSMSKPSSLTTPTTPSARQVDRIRQRNVAATVEASFQRDHAVPDGYGDGARWQAQYADQDLLDHLPADLLIRTQEDPKQVATGDDTDETVLLIHHGKAIDALTFHQSGGIRNTLLRMDGDRRGRHQPCHGRGHRARREVGAGDHPGHLVIVVDDRQGADAVTVQQTRLVTEGRETLIPPADGLATTPRWGSDDLRTASLRCRTRFIWLRSRSCSRSASSWTSVCPTVTA